MDQNSDIAAVPLLAANGVSKSFGHVQALDSVNIAVHAGEIVALLGENGAGKSTFIKILAGVYAPDAGELLVDGRPVRFGSPAEALNAGVATVYQDLALVEQRDVASNLFLGREFTKGIFVDRRRMYKEAEIAVESLDFHIPSVRTTVDLLSGGQRQAVAISRAVAMGGRIVILDEPTAALGVRESAAVLEMINNLREQGRGVILISHNLQHVLPLADRIFVLHRGRPAGVVTSEEATAEIVVRLIMGDTSV
ncbi:MAG: sugar ABC transporter ATP-binding protein [Actinobacteria bacterium]|nr:sugar ABC transporter ATP-binding protein [Actinomycetota bacterium]